ncbi:MAG: ATP-binding protein [Clostridia bacterium]|nr:ATP-binding protein [Clostridia bacterium]
MSTFFSILGKYAVPLVLCIIPIVIAVILIAVLASAKSKEKKYSNLLRGDNDYNRVFAEGGMQVELILGHKNFITVFCSENIEKILGIEHERITNDFMCIEDIFVKKDFREFIAEYKAWDGKASLEKDFLNITNNEYFRINITNNCNGKYDYMVIRNVTKYISREEELQTLVDKAEEESESKTVFLSNMSHDIRTPMNGIIGMLTIAKSKLETDNPAVPYIEKAEDLSGFLLSIINDVLDISRIEAGKFELNLCEFDIDGLIDDLESLNRKNFEEKGLKFTVEKTDCNTKCLVGDELKIKQIISNFLSNSYKFTQNGEVRLSFREMAVNDNEVELMIGVQDTGEGMSTDFLNRVFNPFEQEGRNEDNKIVGSGLGMAIADRFTHLMGGEIFVESQKGVGTHFSICLPMKRGKEENLARNTHGKKVEADIPTSEFSFENLRILLVEDNEINLEIAKSIFELNKAKVTTAVNGKEALDAFVQSDADSFDVILMDIQMPIMNGWQAIEEIRKSGKSDAKDIPMFALTADAYVNNDKNPASKLINGCFLKPIDYDVIKTEVGKAIFERENR